MTLKALLDCVRIAGKCHWIWTMELTILVETRGTEHRGSRQEQISYNR
jgi:hypothetical protein